MQMEKKFIEEIELLKLAQLQNKKKCVLSYEVFEWVLKNIPKGSRILEIGSGKSSKIFSILYQVDSIEHDSKYAGKYAEVKYIYAPIKDYGKYLWYDTSKIKLGLAAKYSLILVDGPTDKTGREGFAINFDLFSKFNCPVLIDEINRKGEAKMLACFLQNGFEIIARGKKHSIIKSVHSKKLNKKCTDSLTKYGKIIIYQTNTTKLPEKLLKRKDFDLCVIYTGKNLEKSRYLKDNSEYYLSEFGLKAHNLAIAFREIPKIKKYSEIWF